MTIIIYTNYLVAEYAIDFPSTKEALAQALDEGPVLLNIKGGGTVFINPINAVAIEIKDTPLS